MLSQVRAVQKERLSRLLKVVAASLLLASVLTPSIFAAQSVQDRSPSALQARLEEAEKSYRSGNVESAITQASSLVGLTDSSAFASDRVSRDAQSDLVLFQLKNGRPDQSAQLIRELLLSLQLDLAADPRYPEKTADILCESPAQLKKYFETVIKRLDEKPETTAIINALVDNTVPKDYATRLKAYCRRVDAAALEMSDLQPIADTEQLKYGDPLTSLAQSDSATKSDPKLNTARLEKASKTLEALAEEARIMPVADARLALGLYRLALAANSAEQYKEAEAYANKSIALVTELRNASAVPYPAKVALAFALLKQGKKEQFNQLRDELARQNDDNERLLVTLARFTELSGDDAGALAIYNRALDNRAKRSDTQQPEWKDAYNTLLKKNESTEK